MIHRFLAGGIDGRQAIGRTHPRMLTICRSPSWTLFSRRRTFSIAAGKTHSRNGAPLRKSTGFASQNRDIMPGIVDRLATAKATRMLTDIHSVLSDDDPVGIGGNLNRTTDRSREDGVRLSSRR